MTRTSFISVEIFVVTDAKAKELFDKNNNERTKNGQHQCVARLIKEFRLSVSNFLDD